MAFVMRSLALVALMSGVDGQYTCPSGFADLTGTPLCAQTTDESCSVGSCCKLTGTLCSSVDAINGNAKCKKGSDTNYFFDLKKTASVAASDSDGDFRDACCTPCSQATCADWQTVKPLTGCGSGKYILGTNVLASSDCSIPADDKYKEACCATQTVTCAATNVISGNSQCKSGPPINDFFDLKKGASEVASDSAFQGACCTKCSAATCADWQTVKLLVGCGTGKSILGTNALASSDCSIPSDDKYKETCCATTPTTCSKTDAISGNAKCKGGTDTNYFFDLKKGTAEVASTSDDDFRGACCTVCTGATCADWATVKFLVGCDTGKSLALANSLPSSDCSIPADDKYKEACCATTPTTCSKTDAISGNAKCKGGTDTNYFFDLKKTAMEVASTSDDDFRGACCTMCTEATCADWQTVKLLVGCGSGKYILGTNVLASSDCSIPADDKYKEACCATTPTTCSSTNALSGNSKCKSTAAINDFFDLKKTASKVGSDSRADFQAACCTKCSAATCADWQTVKGLVGCGSGKYILGTNALASSDCSIPADDKYKEACCATAPIYCSGTDVINGNTKCKTGSDKNYFFDLKKTAMEVASASDGDFRGACCTKCTEATCADWQTVKPLVGCPTGEVIAFTNTLSSSDCSIPTDDKYKDGCCSPPKKCADYDVTQDSTKQEASAAFTKASPFIGTLVASFVVLSGVHNL